MTSQYDASSVELSNSYAHSSLLNSPNTEYFASIKNAIIDSDDEHVEHYDISNVDLNPVGTLTRSTCDGCIYVDGEFISNVPSSTNCDSFEEMNCDSFEEHFASIMDAIIHSDDEHVEHTDISNVNLNPVGTLTRSTCDGCIYVDGEFVPYDINNISEW